MWPPTSSWEATMSASAPGPAQAAIDVKLAAIFVSLELSRSAWLITSLSPGSGEKMSKHSVRGGDAAGLLDLLAGLRARTQARAGKAFPIIAIQEAGLDGFWLHRVLETEGIESHVVDAASILTSRRRRRAKTDRIDGETLLRTLLAHKRGEPRVCAMVRAPSPQQEDRRRLCRERKTLVAERVAHVNRVKGLLFAQGISDYEPPCCTGRPCGRTEPYPSPARGHAMRTYSGRPRSSTRFRASTATASSVARRLSVHER